MESQETAMNPLLLEKISNLPPLPTTITELREYIDSSGANVEATKVAEILSKDPLIIGELLRLSNSPFYGFSRQISTIQQVVSLLGISNIKNIIMANAISSTFPIDVSPYGLDTQVFLAGCSKEVEFISQWLNDEDKQLANLLVPCAMLLRLGVILLSSILIQSKKDKEFLAENQANEFRNLYELENKYCGIDNLSFLGFLFDYWKFDELLIGSIAHIHVPHSAPDEIKKNTYALAIVNCLFEPYAPLGTFNAKKAIALLNEAQESGVNFDTSNFLSKLPQKAKDNLQQS